MSQFRRNIHELRDEAWQPDRSQGCQRRRSEESDGEEEGVAEILEAYGISLVLSLPPSSFEVDLYWQY